MKLVRKLMSDQAKTESKFHELLQEFREEVLPQVQENYASLTDTEKESIAKVHNFYCGLMA